MSNVEKRAAGGAVGVLQMFGETALGLLKMAAKGPGPRAPDLEEIEQAMAVKKFIDHPIDTIKERYSEMATEVNRREAQGDHFGAGRVSAHVVSGDAFLVLGVGEGLVGGVRAGVRAGGRLTARGASAEAGAGSAFEGTVSEASSLAPNTAAIPGDAAFIGPPAPGSWTLSPRGQGAHLVERVNVRGRSDLAALDQPGTPRYYPEGVPEHAGQAHVRIHRATKAEGVELQGGNPGMTDQQLLDAYGKAYGSPDLQGIRGSLRTPNGQTTVGTGMTPSQAYDALLQWLASQGK